uniref:YTH domain-containing protein n=1 Tax=Calcidiscus leptoporus TaxID=127549 RepID=A0A7S0JCS6_9EUKA|mmetsp:Transcript_51782/g.118999  ORF Transcript_51782/g.118999 Transcript_51782/m.118999 type:complete len:556 (+) Transcript_51782:77-1744(+)
MEHADGTPAQQYSMGGNASGEVPSSMLGQPDGGSADFYGNPPGAHKDGALEQHMYPGGAFPPGGYPQHGGYALDAQVAAPATDSGAPAGTPPGCSGMYGGHADGYQFAGAGMSQMYSMNQMLYAGQGGGGAADPSVYYAMAAGGPAGGPGMFGNPMGPMGMGMSGPMGMGVGMGMGGYGPMGGSAVGEDGKLVDGFSALGMGGDDDGGKGKRGSGGSWAEMAKAQGGGRGRGGGGRAGYMAYDGGYEAGRGGGRGRGRGGPNFDTQHKNEERDRERARNGVRGLRSGTAFGSIGSGVSVLSAEMLHLTESINPPSFDVQPKFARFFIIKSYSEDDVHKSIKYGVWASTDTGNRRLDAAYRDSCNKGPIYLFFSVNASGQFSGMAQMECAIDYTKKFGCWAQDKWSGTFAIKWVFIKDVPNNQFRQILLSNNENKPVTNSRDTQEILLEPGKEMLRIFHQYKSKTSILDDFGFYDKRQELMEARAQMPQGMPPMPPGMPPAMQPGMQSQSLQQGMPPSGSQGMHGRPLEPLQMQGMVVGPSGGPMGHNGFPAGGVR